MQVDSHAQGAKLPSIGPGFVSDDLPSVKTQEHPLAQSISIPLHLQEKYTRL